MVIVRLSYLSLEPQNVEIPKIYLKIVNTLVQRQKFFENEKTKVLS